jgi:hypothetical protein
MPRERTGPWFPSRDVLALLEGHVARALVEDLREARLELARAAACVAFGLGWLALHVARCAHFTVGVVVEVGLVLFASFGAAALLVGDARRIRAHAYRAARRALAPVDPYRTAAPRKALP